MSEIQERKNKAIPTVSVPSIREYEISSSDEQLISLRERGLIVKSQYNQQGIPGSYSDCYARETVADMLVKAQHSLEGSGYSLVIWDAYRPICIQQRLWNFYRQDIKNNNPGLGDVELDFKTRFFVSKPSYDVKHPSLHNTGGAVDLTLCDENGDYLDMGTKFDEFSGKSWTNHFEEIEQDDKVRDNRRLLYNTMIEAGFTNLPSEWWHYDYGDKFWAYFTENEAIYDGVIDMDFPDRFPLR